MKKLNRKLTLAVIAGSLLLSMAGCDRHHHRDHGHPPPPHHDGPLPPDHPHPDRPPGPGI